VVLLCLSSSCVFCTQCCQFLWIGHFRLPFRYSITYILTRRKTCLTNIKLLSIKMKPK
jgi:hypothetical protein